MTKTKKEKEKPKVCYFCLWNPPVTEIHRGREVLSACRHCATIMEPLVNSKGVWGWSLAALRPVHPDMDELGKQPMRKCPYCSFQNIYQKSMAAHLKYTHRPGHTYAENEQTVESKQDWLKKVGRRW